MTCYSCGATLPSGAKFCGKCGASQAITAEQITAAQAGDQQAIADLYNRTYPAVYRSVRAMIRDESTALDIVQDAYIKGFQSLNQLERPEQFAAWMKRIAANRAKDWLKRKKPMLFSEMAAEDGDSPELQFEDTDVGNLPEVVIDRQETARLMNEILGTLSEDQRMAIALYYYDQRSVREIAEIMECTEGTVKSRLNYGRKKIEAKVRTLEAQGTKLYGLAPIPFLTLLFRVSESTPVVPSAAVLQGVTGAVASTAAASTAAAGSATVAGSTAGTVAAATASAAGKSLAIKITAAVLASLAVVGGGVAAGTAIVNRANSEPAAPVVAEVEEVPETVQEPDIVPEAPAEPEPPQEAEIEPPAEPDLPEEEPQEEVLPEETEIPEETPVPITTPSDAYYTVLSEYVEAISLQDSSQYTAFSEEHPDLDQELLTTYLPQAAGDPVLGVYYTYYDLNSDDTPELLLMWGEGSDFIYGLTEVYSCIDGEAVLLADSSDLLTPGFSALLSDGRICVLNTDTGVQTVYQLSDDGTRLDATDGAYDDALWSNTIDEELGWYHLSADGQIAALDSGSDDLSAAYDAYAAQLSTTYNQRIPDELASYAAVDLNGDGMPELIEKLGTSEVNYVYHFYTYEGGAVKEIGAAEGWHAWVYGDNSGNVFLLVRHMGAVIDYLVTYDGSSVQTTEIDVGDYTDSPIELEVDLFNGLDLTALQNAFGMR